MRSQHLAVYFQVPSYVDWLSRADQTPAYAFYKRLLALRRELPREVEVRAGEQTLTVRRGRAELHADFAKTTVELRT